MSEVQETTKNETSKVVLSNVGVSFDTNSLHVKITDINMPFMSMVTFMVKWAFATIPAIIIITILVMIVSIVLGGTATGLGR